MPIMAISQRPITAATIENGVKKIAMPKNDRSGCPTIISSDAVPTSVAIAAIAIAKR